MRPKHIVVIGDTIIDHAVYGKAVGLSLETPTIKGKYLREEYSFGGAANVVNNLLTLRQKVTFITPVSTSKYGNLIRTWSSDRLKILCLENDMENFVKSRYWLSRGDSYYKVMQMNQGEAALINNCEYKKIMSVVENEQLDLVVLVDYWGGTFDDPEQTKKIISMCNKRNIKVVSSSQISGEHRRHEYFKNSHIICMNKKEAIENNPYFEVNKTQMNQLFHLLKSKICVTLGSEGAAYYDGKDMTRFPAQAVKAIDTCGAGDSFLAALCSRIETVDIEFSNKWAAQSTLEKGTIVPQYKNNE